MCGILIDASMLHLPHSFTVETTRTEKDTVSYLLWRRHFTWHISSWSNKYLSKETMQIPLLFTQFLKGNKLNEMWHMIQITLNAYFRQFLKKIFISMCQISGISNRMLHVNHASEPHINQDSFTFHTISCTNTCCFSLKCVSGVEIYQNSAC